MINIKISKVINEREDDEEQKSKDLRDYQHSSVQSRPDSLQIINEKVPTNEKNLKMQRKRFSVTASVSENKNSILLTDHTKKNKDSVDVKSAEKLVRTDSEISVKNITRKESRFSIPKIESSDLLHEKQFEEKEKIRRNTNFEIQSKLSLRKNESESLPFNKEILKENLSTNFLKKSSISLIANSMKISAETEKKINKSNTKTKKNNNKSSTRERKDSSYPSSNQDSENEDFHNERHEKISSTDYKKKSSILYELNHLDLLKQALLPNKKILNNLDENHTQKESTKSEEKKANEFESVSDSELIDNIDINKELGALFKDRNLTINKFMFSPQVTFRFTQKYDVNPGVNVNDIEINEYNMNSIGYDSNIQKNKFLHTKVSNNFLNLSSKNKYLEMIDLDELLPVEVHRKRIKNFEKTRKKERILMNRGKVVEIFGKPILTFSGLKYRKNSIKNEKKNSFNDIDIIKCGGSNQVIDEIHSSERIYCRLKNMFNLEALSLKRRSSLSSIVNLE